MYGYLFVLFCFVFFLIQHVPDPKQCTVQGRGADRAEIECKTSFVLRVINCCGEPCSANVVTASITSRTLIVKTSTICCNVKENGTATYEISYIPKVRGRHNLNVYVNGVEVKNSPFRVFVEHPPARLKNAKPILVIDEPTCCLNPNRIKMDRQSRLIVTSWQENKVFWYKIVATQNENGEVFVHGNRDFEIGGVENQDGELIHPNGVAVDKEGYIYVADWGNNRVQKFSQDGKFVAAFGCAGKKPGQFNCLTGMEINNDGKLFVGDFMNGRVQVVDADFENFACSGTEGGFENVACFGTEGKGKLNQPEDIAFDSDGKIYVTDGKNNCVLVYGNTETYLFVQFDGNSKPTGIHIDCSGFVYVVERAKHQVSVFDSHGKLVTTFGKDADFAEPLGLTIDEDGFIYICDSLQNRIQVF